MVVTSAVTVIVIIIVIVIVVIKMARRRSLVCVRMKGLVGSKRISRAVIATLESV